MGTELSTEGRLGSTKNITLSGDHRRSNKQVQCLESASARQVINIVWFKQSPSFHFIAIRRFLSLPWGLLELIRKLFPQPIIAGALHVTATRAVTLSYKYCVWRRLVCGVLGQLPNQARRTTVLACLRMQEQTAVANQYSRILVCIPG